MSFITLLLVFNKNITAAAYSLDLKTFNAIAFNIIGMIMLYSVYKLYWQNVYIDELTGVPNRRAHNEQLKKLGRKYTIAMLDIDHFKKFNDTYGHTEGDNVLRFVATHLDETSHAKLFRYGGEEFSAIYPGQKISDVYWRLEQMRESLANRYFSIRMNESKRIMRSDKDRGRRSDGVKKVKLTISVGVAQRSEKFKTPEDVIEAADKALYSAKKKGRNQCAVKRGVSSVNRMASRRAVKINPGFCPINTSDHRNQDSPLAGKPAAKFQLPAGPERPIPPVRPAATSQTRRGRDPA